MSKKLVVKFTTDKLKKLVDDKRSCVLVHKSVYSLQLYPYHLSDISASIKELLNAKVAKYDKKLDGILLGYKNLKLITPQGSIIFDSCYIHIDIEGDFYIFKPEIKSLLTGIVNKTIDNHVGCLVHGLFNVSVPNVDEENWAGHDVNIGDKVILRVDFMDFEARLPYIKAQLVKTTTKAKKKKIKKEEADVSPTKKKKIKKEQNIEDTKINNNGSHSDLNFDESLIKKKKKSKQINNSVETIENIIIKTEKKRKSTELENNLNTSKSKKEKIKLKLELNGNDEERTSTEIENNLNTSKFKKENNKLKSKLNNHVAVKSEEFNESIKIEQLENFNKSPKLKKKSSKVDESVHFNLAQIAALNESNTLKRNSNSAEDKKVNKRKRKGNDILENDEKPKKKQKLGTNKGVTEVKKKTKTKKN